MPCPSVGHALSGPSRGLKNEDVDRTCDYSDSFWNIILGSKSQT
jgi:hypothetical protein